MGSGSSHFGVREGQHGHSIESTAEIECFKLYSGVAYLVLL
jgi:hypothetical protein